MVKFKRVRELLVFILIFAFLSWLSVFFLIDHLVSIVGGYRFYVGVACGSVVYVASSLLSNIVNGVMNNG